MTQTIKIDYRHGLGKRDGETREHAALGRDGEFQELQNVRLDLGPTVVGKRLGAEEIAITLDTDPASTVEPSRLNGVWHRGAEILVEADGGLYSRRVCSGAGTVTPGTATVGEISDALAALDERGGDPAPDGGVQHDLPHAPIANAATPDALARLDVPNDTPGPWAMSNLGVDVSVTLDFSPPRISWTGDDTGTVALNPAAQRILIIQQSGSRLRMGASRPGVSPYSILDVYDVDLNPGAPSGSKVSVNATGSILNVVGVSGGSAWDMTSSGSAVALTEVAGEWRIVDQAGFYTLQPTHKSALLSATNTYKLGAVGRAGLDGPLVAIAPTSTSAAPASATMSFFDLPFATGGVAPDPIRCDVFYFASSSTIGVAGGAAYGGAIAIAIRNANGSAPDLSLAVSGSDLVWNSPAAVTSRVKSGSYGLVHVNVVAGVELSPRTLFSTYAAASAWVDRGAGHAGAAVSFTATGYYYDSPANAVRPFLRQSLSGAYACAIAADGAGGVLAIMRRSTSHRLFESFSPGVFQVVDVVTPAAGTTVQQNPVSVALDSTGPGAFRALVSAHVEATSTLHTYSYSSATNTATYLREYRLVIARAFAKLTAATLLAGAWPRALIALGVGSVSPVVYERTEDYFVQVNPSLAGLPGGSFGDKGPWTRSVLDETVTDDRGATQIYECGAVRITSAGSPDQSCIVQLTESAGDGVNLSTFSTSIEARALVDVSGKDPHVARVNEETALLAYVNSAHQVQYQRWQTGDAIGFAPAGLNLDTANIYDVSASSYLDGGVIQYTDVFIGRTGPATATARVHSDTYPAQTQTIAPAGWTSIDAVSCNRIMSDTEPLAVFVVVGVKGAGIFAHVSAYEFPNPPSLRWSREIDLGLPTATYPTILAATITMDTSTALDDATFAVEVATATPQTQVRVHRVSNVADSYVRNWNRAAIYGSAEVLVTSGVDAPLMALSNISPTGRRERGAGLFLVSMLTGEVIGRTLLDDAESLSSRFSSRNQVVNLSIYGQEVALPGLAHTAASYPTAVAMAEWHFDRTPNRPAVLSGVACSAHGGYPRAYDGRAPFEHDWHELPEFDSVTALAAGGAIAAGSYGVAVSYEYTDAQGLLYRAAPYLFSLSVVAPSNAIRVRCKPLSFTERRDVTLTVWRTLTNGTIYYLAASADAVQDVPYIEILLSQADTTLTSSPIVLDQVPGGTRLSLRVPVGRFVAAADGRFFAPGSGRKSEISYTTPEDGGYAPHWDTAQRIVSADGLAVTAAAALSNMLVFFTGGSASIFAAGGPDSTGIGSYGQPSLVLLSRGAVSMHALASAPGLGIAYGTERGVYTFSQSGGADIGAQLQRVWRTDRPLTIEWDAFGGCLRCSTEGGQSYRYHVETGRWSEDTGRAAVDTSVSDDGAYAVLLSDGRLLIDDRTGANYQDGAQLYPVVVETSWQRFATAGTFGRFITKESRLYGVHRGAHGLVIDVFGDGSHMVKTDAAGVVTNPSSFTHSEAEIDARAAAGDRYMTVVSGDNRSLDAVAYRFTIGPTAGDTAILEGIDVTADAESGGAYTYSDSARAKRA